MRSALGTGEFDTLKHVRRFLCLVDNLRKTLDDVMLPGCSSHEGHTVHSSCLSLSEMFFRFCICDPRDVLSVADDEAATQNALLSVRTRTQYRRQGRHDKGILWRAVVSRVIADGCGVLCWSLLLSEPDTLEGCVRPFSFGLECERGTCWRLHSWWYGMRPAASAWERH